jgi:hypothetical protein
VRTSLGASLLAGGLVLAGQFPVGADVSHPPAPDRQRRPQTSDGVRGALAPWVPPERRGKATWTTLNGWEVVPGITYEEFDLVDARGPVRGHLLRIDLTAPGISLDYAGRPDVSSRAPLLDTVLEDGAIAGVNGDFFDIRDTDAPLGVGRDRERKFLHGKESGWNSAFFLTKDGVPDIDYVYADAVVTQRPDLDITTINSPAVRQGGIGLYTDKWGVLRDHQVTDGQKNKTRMVVIRNGVVTQNTRRFPKQLDVTGKVLIGRDQGALALRGLVPGTQLNIKTTLTPNPLVAITGNVFLMRDGKKLAKDDRDLHPRTALGITEDRTGLILLVVDGRETFSRGLTMVELARLMQQLGSYEAINLDGGGSSTMVARKRNGKVKVLNTPSDGKPRDVPNGLEILYAPPVVVPPPTNPPTDPPAP